MSEKFDLIVIGGGSGGIAHARRAAEYGARAAVVEYGPLGGTCVNVGCVPKKVMWYTASHAHHFHHAPDYGFDVDVNRHDWSMLKSRRDAYISRLNGIYQRNLENSNVRIIRGTATFADPHSIDVAGRRFTAQRVVIATGGRPIVPDLPNSDQGITSDDFFELEERPGRVLVAGSGYVAVELAGVFNALGSETCLLIRKESVVRSFDAMLGKEVMAAMRADGITIATGFIPERVDKQEGGLVITSVDGRSFGPADCILWAVGRRPNTDGLGLENAGVETDARGFVTVDKYQTTNVDHIFGLGDVTGCPALTPVAIAAGRRLADRLYGGMEDRHLDYELIPTVIFSHPPMGTIGMTEEQARANFGDDVKVYTSGFTAMYYALGEKKQRSVMKLITAGADERIVGCHIIGDGADEMLQGFAVAMNMGATKRDFDDTIAIHPTSAEELVTLR